MNQGYTFIRTVLDNKLTSVGYHVTQEEYHQKAFGSCYIVWSNDNELLRLIWDGREYNFILQRGALPLTLHTQWVDITVSPYETRQHDLQAINRITIDMLNELEREKNELLAKLRL